MSSSRNKSKQTPGKADESSPIPVSPVRDPKGDGLLPNPGSDAIGTSDSDGKVDKDNKGYGHLNGSLSSSSSGGSVPSSSVYPRPITFSAGKHDLSICEVVDGSTGTTLPYVEARNFLLSLQLGTNSPSVPAPLPPAPAPGPPGPSPSPPPPGPPGPPAVPVPSPSIPNRVHHRALVEPLVNAYMAPGSKLPEALSKCTTGKPEQRLSTLSAPGQVVQQWMTQFWRWLLIANPTSGFHPSLPILLQDDANDTWFPESFLTLLYSLMVSHMTSAAQSESILIAGDSSVGFRDSITGSGAKLYRHLLNQIRGGSDAVGHMLQVVSDLTPVPLEGVPTMSELTQKAGSIVLAVSQLEVFINCSLTANFSVALFLNALPPSSPLRLYLLQSITSTTTLSEVLTKCQAAGSTVLRSPGTSPKPPKNPKKPPGDAPSPPSSGSKEGYPRKCFLCLNKDHNSGNCPTYPPGEARNSIVCTTCPAGSSHKTGRHCTAAHDFYTAFVAHQDRRRVSQALLSTTDNL